MKIPMAAASNKNFHLDSDLREKISVNLQSFELLPENVLSKRKAAVALTVVNVGQDSPVYGIGRFESTEAALILTRRSERLKNHAGQWALPGGSIDPGETPEETALRELEEEVGLRLNNEAVLGLLDDFTTRSGFTITPVVLWGGNDPSFRPNHDEVESIHCIPLREFMREDAPVLQSIPESRNPVLLMPVGKGWIASPTGAIIYQFREVALCGEEVRVSHYEQPYFAWK